ncbi:hypothetical protein [Pedobacter sp.]
MKINLQHIGKCLFQFSIFVSVMFFSITAFSQVEKEKLFWSATRKLKAEDFEIKLSSNATGPGFAQFSIDYSVNGFDFLTKNFNKRVQNYMIPAASTIDTTQNNDAFLNYQQSLFDISEIYVRRFRKALRENRKQALKGTDYAKQLNATILSDFSKRRAEYSNATNFGTNLVEQQNWQRLIHQELAALENYAYEK